MLKEHLAQRNAKAMLPKPHAMLQKNGIQQKIKSAVAPRHSVGGGKVSIMPFNPGGALPPPVQMPKIPTPSLGGGFGKPVKMPTPDIGHRKTPPVQMPTIGGPGRIQLDPREWGGNGGFQPQPPPFTPPPPPDGMIKLDPREWGGNGGFRGETLDPGFQREQGGLRGEILDPGFQREQGGLNGLHGKDFDPGFQRGGGIFQKFDPRRSLQQRPNPGLQRRGLMSMFKQLDPRLGAQQLPQDFFQKFFR